MGIFSKLLRGSVVGGGSLTGTDDFWYNAVGGGPTKSGTRVNEETALKYLTVLSCVTLIANDIARLPLILYQKNKDGSKSRVLYHNLADILHNAPNPQTTSFNFRETLQSALLLQGNSHAKIKRVGRSGEILSLTQIPMQKKVQLKKYNSRWYYQWNEPGKGTVKKIKQDIFHVPGFGFNGTDGMSMIALARETIGLGMATEDYGALFFGQGTHPAGTLSMEGNLGDNRKEYTDFLKTQYAGLGKSHNIMVLEHGLKYDHMAIPLNDAQFLETRKFQKSEIAAMYHVPLHKLAIHDSNTNNNNLEQENGAYVDSCLMPWACRWEQNIALQLLTQEERKKGLYVEFLFDALLRGDSQARAEYYNKIFQVGGIQPNEIRAKENMNPVPGGDESFVMLNMVPLGMAQELAQENNQEPAKKEGKNLRFIEYRAKNSIMLRDRIAKQYYPLFERAAQEIVNKEGLAVKGQVNKQRKLRENRDMQGWLDDFYRKMPAEIKSKIGPVIRSFSEAIQAAAAEEMGVDVGISDDLEKFIDDYSERYAERHTESSLGQLTALLEEDLDALETRVDEWAETRAEKIASNETVRASNAVYQAVAFGAGFSTVWRIRGAKTCPFCKSLAGKRVSSGQSFVNDGDELNPEGAEAPMKIRGIKAHPPLHQKCLPGNANITAFGITASSEDWFDGDMFVIHTASGNKITCTPNHPILTCHGWVNADKINVGNQVRKTISSNWDTSVIGDSKNVKALIKDVAKSFIDTSKMIAVPVPTSSKNFEGNIFDSKITIIRTDGSLLLERNPSLFHKLRKFNLDIRNLGDVSLISDSSFTEFIKARFPSECSSMSSRDLLLSLGGGHTFPIEQPSFTLPTEFDPIENKIFINNQSGNSETFRNGVDRFPIEVLADEVIRVESNSFHGLVYNLHTKDNLFYTENIVVHNCDCYLSIS